MWEYTSTTTTILLILLNQAKRLKYCWEKCPLVALRDEGFAKMWQKRVWQNTARLPNGFLSTTSLTPLLFILTNFSWKVLLKFWAKNLQSFFVIKWRSIEQLFWTVKACCLLMASLQLSPCRPLPALPLWELLSNQAEIDFNLLSD